MQENISEKEPLAGHRPLVFRFYARLAADICIIALSLFLAYFIRFDMSFPRQYAHQYLLLLLMFVPVKLAALAFFDLYRVMWRYTSIHDLVNLVVANSAASAVIIIIIMGIFRFYGFSRGIFIIDYVLSIAFMATLRIFVRLQGTRPRHVSKHGRNRSCQAKRVLIIGAGNMGEKIVREILENGDLLSDIVGIIDDDPVKKGLKLHGVPVMGNLAQMKGIAQREGIDEIIIAISTLSAQGMRRIVEACDATGLTYRTVPGIWELIEGRVSIAAVRDVRYEDLLGREPVSLDMRSIGDYLLGKCVMVTGGAGSIGSELCRQIARVGPEKLIVLDKDESGIYNVEIGLKDQNPLMQSVAMLGPVQNVEMMERIFEEHRPNVVFHAAAYKHVPMLEHHPWEAVFNNMIGTRNVMDFSNKYGVERVVLVSTDKAVRPTNVMGASKRVAELITQAYAGENGAQFMAVRFGNVVGSVGSVVPLFLSQIEKGGPVTVTHPEVTRYFMTIPEACSLILQAGALGRGGEIFVLKMGTPVKIYDMAKDIINLHGLEPGKDIEIKFVGLRPGEKLYEELITEGEDIVPTSHKDIMVLNSQPSMTIREIDQYLAELVRLAKGHDGDAIRKVLCDLVKEYQPSKGAPMIRPARNKAYDLKLA